jgi:hypothetical protein
MKMHHIQMQGGRLGTFPNGRFVGFAQLPEFLAEVFHVSILFLLEESKKSTCSVASVN